MHPTSDVSHDIYQAIVEALTEDPSEADVQVRGGSGHYTVTVVSRKFVGKSTLEAQRLVYAAIAPLMSGAAAPVHAIDRMVTRAP